MGAAADATLLERYHQHAGRTVTMFAPAKDARGEHTYLRLLHELQNNPSDDAILDLACGDGYLLKLLADAGFTNLVGVDASSAELQAARARVGPRVALHCARAERLPFADHAFSVVTCHLALMLMAPLPPVLAEIARVLRPGGTLLALTNRFHPHPLGAAFSQRLARATEAAGMTPLRLGTPNVWRANELHAPPFTAQHCEDFVVTLSGEPAAVWQFYGLTYDVYQLPLASQHQLRDEVIQAWQELTRPVEQITIELGMRLISCRTEASG